MDKIILSEKLSQFSDHWAPRVVGELNGHDVKVAKLKGEFVWHRHENEDEMFLVLKGRLTVRLRHGEVVLDEGEVFIVPRGVEHQPVAEEEAHVLLVEPCGTVNTGTATDDPRTVRRPERI